MTTKMKTVFISKLKALLDALAEQMDLYVPKKAGEHRRTTQNIRLRTAS